MEQHRFAKHIGCSEETIRKIEKGRLKLSEELAYKISVATGVDSKWLLANDLTIAPFRGRRPYTKSDFEDAQAKNSGWDLSPAVEAHALLVYFARIIAISGVNWKADFKDWRVAMYRLNAALEDLEKCGSFGKKVNSPENPDFLRAIKLVKKLVEDAEASLVKKPLPRGPSSIRPGTEAQMRASMRKAALAAEPNKKQDRI